MKLYAHTGQSIQSFAKVLVKANEASKEQVIGVFNDKMFGVKENETAEELVYRFERYI